MRKSIPRFCFLGFAFCIVAAAAAGCDNAAINKDSKTTFLDSGDMVTMTNRMAQSIIADPRVQDAWRTGALKVVIKPVDNQTNEIIPPGEGELFVARLEGLLAQQPALRDKFTWVINKSDYDKLIAEEIAPTRLGPPETRIQPEYALWAEFHSITDAKRKSRSDTYLCQYKLTRISGDTAGATIWEGQYETSKTIKRDWFD